MAQLATAEIVRHVISVPAILFGLVLVRWAQPVADGYASAFRWVGMQPYSEHYANPSGKWLVRAVGAIFVVVGIYWVLVGTG